MNPNSVISPLEDVDALITELRQILTSKNYDLDILPRKKDEDPLDPHTTENTMADLDYDTEDVKNELLSLTSREYLETILDNKGIVYPPFWVFGKTIKGKGVYVKVKVRSRVTSKIFCVSFHYPRYPFKTGPYA